MKKFYKEEDDEGKGKTHLVTRLKYPPVARQPPHDPCLTVFSVVSQTIAATPPLLSVKVAYRNPKDRPWRGLSREKLASEAYRAVGSIT